MGDRTLSTVDYDRIFKSATRGGTTKATFAAEQRFKDELVLDPLVDPKGLAHLGPVRMSLPRFEPVGNLWRLTRGLAMAEETLLDTTGSMGDNVDIAFGVLPNSYGMYTSGVLPILGRYDVQIATAIFNDVEDGVRWEPTAVLARSQFEMAEKIAQQMSMLPPGRNGCGNGKEDPQFGLFGAAYLTAASINRWGLKYYHFTVSDEPVVPRIDQRWLEKLFGDDVLDKVRENGHDIASGNLPDTAQTVRDLQTRAHAFFLQVNGRYDVREQWRGLYGDEHFVQLPGGGTEYLHYVKAVIIGLTEGVLDLQSATEFLRNNELDGRTANLIVRSVAHIPLAAQTLAPNFDKIPKAGDLFRNKTDLEPIDPSEVEQFQEDAAGADTANDGPAWL